MAFGHGFTGLIIAAIVSLTSGIAFILCLREFVRELASQPVRRFEKALRKNRNMLLDDAGGFVVDDDVFSDLLKSRAEVNPARREWNDPSTYLFMVSFLGLVALAGFVAGLSHFS